eukprot:TRINITY_DN26510_c0_g3_i1.p1 TRINITY_DN26510_c0_g3~~TRINITY_DN26510_c0_g3_i1.p1  ORF type:complete len:375 (-),score=8.81 TRINITY_DN26510_c0_g3_i1:463-1587(-)
MGASCSAEGGRCCKRDELSQENPTEDQSPVSAWAEEKVEHHTVDAPHLAEKVIVTKPDLGVDSPTTAPSDLDRQSPCLSARSCESSLEAFKSLRADLAQSCGDGPDWLEIWDKRRLKLDEFLDEPYPPKDWIGIECHREKDSYDGSMYSKYIDGEHSIQIRCDLILPGTVIDHFEGLMEPDLASLVCPSNFSHSAMQRSPDIPGNFLMHFVIKPPGLPSRFNRDIVMHRQVYRYKQGFAAVDYSPKCLPGNPCQCSSCHAYFSGGGWRNGLPGVDIPKCTCLGRDAQFSGYYIEKHERGVRWRTIQIIELTTPRWFPVPRSWYAVASLQVARTTLTGFTRARQDPSTEALYRKRTLQHSSNYQKAWWNAQENAS